jgi:hypothetical protein
MKTIDKFIKFWNIYNNCINGNISDYKLDLNKLNKLDVVRFNNFLLFEKLHSRIEVNSHNELIIVEN